jgi:hypothetical protein
VLDDANIAGIAIACFVFVVGVAVSAYVCVRRRNRGETQRASARTLN